MLKNFYTKFTHILVLLVFLANIHAAVAKEDYDRIYKNQPVLDYIYETGVDAEEMEDYEGYFISPYVLVRLPMKLYCQKVELEPGYYLVKPENKYGHNFAVFKQNGKVMGVVPVYKKYRVNPDAIFPAPQKPNHKWYVKPFAATWHAVNYSLGKIFKQRKVSAPPRAKIQYEISEDNKYFDLGLFVESSLYKMLFRLEK
jgi:hypothetical protein